MHKRNDDLFQLLGFVKNQFNEFGASSISLFNRLEKGNFPVYQVTFNPNNKEVEIKLALAGYKKSDISIEQKDGALRIASVKANDETQNESIQPNLDGLEELENAEVKVEEPLVYWSSSRIAKRAFSLEFSVNSFKVSKPAKFEDGLLILTLQKVEEQPSKVDIE